MAFRINYNGQQVSGTFDAYADVKRACLEQADYSARIGQAVPYMWIQEYVGDGDWTGAHLPAAKRKPHEHRG